MIFQMMQNNLCNNINNCSHIPCMAIFCLTAKRPCCSIWSHLQGIHFQLFDAFQKLSCSCWHRRIPPKSIAEEDFKGNKFETKSAVLSWKILYVPAQSTIMVDNTIFSQKGSLEHENPVFINQGFFNNCWRFIFLIEVKCFVWNSCALFAIVSKYLIALSQLHWCQLAYCVVGIGVTSFPISINIFIINATNIFFISKVWICSRTNCLSVPMSSSNSQERAIDKLLVKRTSSLSCYRSSSCSECFVRIKCV